MKHVKLFEAFINEASITLKPVGRDTGVKLNIKSIKKQLEKDGYIVRYDNDSSMVNPNGINVFNPDSGHTLTIRRNGELFGDDNWGTEVKTEKEVIKALDQYEKDLSESVNEGAFVLFYEDEKGKHLLGTFHNKKAAKKYQSEVQEEILDTKGVEGMGMMSKDMWDKKEAPYIQESINEARYKHMDELTELLGDIDTMELMDPDGFVDQMVTYYKLDADTAADIFDAYWSLGAKDRFHFEKNDWEKFLKKQGIK